MSPGVPVSLLLALLAAPATAAEPAPGGAETIALGGTSRAGLSGLGSVLAAPALLGLWPRYELQAGGALGPDKLRALHANAMDSNTSAVALGLGWQYHRSEPEAGLRDLPGWIEPGTDLSNPTARTVLGGGLGGGLLGRRLGLGLGFSWHNRATRFRDTESWFEGNVSLATRLGQEQQAVLSLVADNLLNPGHDLTPMTFGAGLALRPVMEFGLLGQLDLVTGLFDQPVELGFGTGLEGVLAHTVALRGGFSRDPRRDSDLVGLGLGVRSPEVALDYAAELVVGHAGDPPPGWEDGRLRHQHTLTLTLFLGDPAKAL